MRITTIESQTIIRHGHIVMFDTEGFEATLYQFVEDYKANSTTFTPREIDGAEVSPVLAGRKIVTCDKRRINFADLVARSEQTDYAIWSIAETETQYGHPFNRIVETVHSKRHRDHNARWQETSSIKVLVPLESLSPEDWVVHVACHPDYPLVCNSSVEQLGLYETIAAVMPTMAAPAEVTSTNGAQVEIEVTMGNVPTSAQADVFAETSGGYLPLTRVRSAAHKAKFRLMPLGLNAGESVRVKFGFRYYSGLAATTVKVV